MTLSVFDMFSGCGGFRAAAEKIGFKTSAYCEINKWAKKFYDNAFNTENERYFLDATKIICGELPDFGLLTAGFPCQPFSLAGKRRGFSDTRGTLFFDVLRILHDKQPLYFILENVKGLLVDDNRNTFKIIIESLTELGYYSVEWALLNSKYFGVPQNRERTFIVGYPRRYGIGKIFPLAESTGHFNKTTDESGQRVSSAISTKVDRTESTYIVESGTLRTHKDNKGFRKISDNISPCLNARAREDGNGQTVVSIPVLTPERKNKRQNGRCFKDNEEDMFTLTTQDRHGVFNGKRIRRLTPLECFRLQGFDDEIFYKGSKDISDTQLYKLAGNSVTVNVVYEIAKKIMELHKEFNSEV